MAPTEEEIDYLATSTGLEGEIVLTFQDAEFGYDAQVGNGETLLLLVDALHENEDGEVAEREDRFGCGKGWETVDGGKTATPVDGTKKRKGGFHQATAIGLLINGLVAIDEDAMRARAKELGSANTAAFWKGLKIKAEQKEFKTKINGEDVSYNRWIPTAILSAGKKARGAAKKQTAAAASEDEATSQPASAIDAPTMKKLKRMAEDLVEEGKTHNDFMEQAFTEFELDEDAQQVIMDDGETGIWAQAGGK